jgi:hypothetical protein
VHEPTSSRSLPAGIHLATVIRRTGKPVTASTNMRVVNVVVWS